MARRVTRVSRGIRLPVAQEPVLPPPSVRDRVVDGLQWPEGTQMDPGIILPPPPGTSTDVLEHEGVMPLTRQEIAARPPKRRRRRNGGTPR